MNQIITIPDRYTARGVTWLSYGGQYTGALPVGVYRVAGTCLVTYQDAGRTVESPDAVQLIHLTTGEKWYVGKAVAEWLIETHSCPLTPEST